MELFNVYPLYDVTPQRAFGSKVWDENGVEYLDLYGGHGVISIGHSHPVYVSKLKEQLEQIGFYSNAIQNPLQKELATKLGAVSGCDDYNLFLCNSGAEANENALKVASFVNGKKRVIAFENGFHGRTSGAVAVTDNTKINAPFTSQFEVVFLPLNDIALVKHELGKKDVAAVIIEGIQGVGGLDQGTTEFFQDVEKACKKFDALLILDEIQSGYGRTGNFFAFQKHGIHPDIITTAKGMGNGFPIAGVLIHESIEAWHGMLGTTFGGNHLACAAGIAVLDVLVEEELMEQVKELEVIATNAFKELPYVKNIKGRGLMLGLEFDFEVAELRKKLIYEKHIFTGGAMNKNLLRILPPLNCTIKDIKKLVDALNDLVK